jgi:hypothetical protein
MAAPRAQAQQFSSTPSQAMNAAIAHGNLPAPEHYFAMTA